MMGHTTYDSPPRLWLLRSIFVTESPSSPMLEGSVNPAFPFNSMVRFSTNFQRKRATGISPERPIQMAMSVDYQQKYEACRTEHTNLTVETAVVHHELLEVGKGAPLRWDSTGELVCVADAAVKVEHFE